MSHEFNRQCSYSDGFPCKTACKGVTSWRALGLSLIISTREEAEKNRTEDILHYFSENITQTCFIVLRRMIWWLWVLPVQSSERRTDRRLRISHFSSSQTPRCKTSGTCGCSSSTGTEKDRNSHHLSIQKSLCMFSVFKSC